ncbi:glycoside hydrolase family 18 protein [Spiroplasma cantharicola]|uniref:Lipoprotein n=1 Tax=Spiroplasma cantharicola TaxID=362837 RepID=A0A0M5KCH0_9MOLU|nr:hypothetical protein [Spiroplasma cantharicola]ALD66669.1 hypothetical protein SCANT_v1c07630 [Spiroplasma cantharicola]
MKKLLAALASVSFLVSTTATTVVACSFSLKDIESFKYNFDLGEMAEVNQKEIIKAIAKINNITVDSKKDIERIANFQFDVNSIKEERNLSYPSNFNLTRQTENESKIKNYVATIRTSEYSRIAKGTAEIHFKASEEAIRKARNPIQQSQSTLMGYWWNWGNVIGKEQLGWREPQIKAVIESEKNPYDIINISSLYTKEGEGDINSLNINDFTTEPETADRGVYDIDNSQYLIDRKQKKENQSLENETKIIANWGGATADRMIWKWKQKDQLRDRIYFLVDTYGLDGISLAIAGKTLYNRESQATISQVIKEIMVIYWLNNKDFYLSLSTKIQWLFKDGVSTNKPTSIPFIEDLNGWYENIDLLMYNAYRDINFVTAKEDISIEYNGNTTFIKKGEKIKSTYGIGKEEDPAYFYGTLKNLIDKKWNDQAEVYYLGDKPVKIGVASTYSSSASGFKIKDEEDPENGESNWSAALVKLAKDKNELGESITRNLLGFSFFGINIDQILSNPSSKEPLPEDESGNIGPKNPKKWNNGINLKKFIENSEKDRNNKTRF